MKPTSTPPPVQAPPSRNGTRPAPVNRIVEEVEAERQARRSRIRRYLVADMARPVRRGGSVAGAEDEEAPEKDASWTEAEKAAARDLRAAEIEVADRNHIANRPEVDPWNDPAVALPAWYIDRLANPPVLARGGVLDELVEAEAERVAAVADDAHENGSRGLSPSTTPRTPRNIVRDLVRRLPVPRPGRDGSGTLTHAQRHVLGALVARADGELRRGCWPNRRTIAEDAGYDRPKAVDRHLRELEDKGWIRRIPCYHSNGRRGSNVFAFGVPAEAVEEGS